MDQARNASIFVSRDLPPEFMRELAGIDGRFDLSCRRNPDKGGKEFGAYSHLLEVELMRIEDEEEAIAAMKAGLVKMMTILTKRGVTAEPVWYFGSALDEGDDAKGNQGTTT